MSLHKFTLIINAGRSGSSYMYNVLQQNFAEDAYIAHEDIPVQISQPRKYNRAYNESAISQVLQDQNLKQYIDNWQRQLEVQPVIETGWTAAHLAPVLRHVFQEQFQYVILHRHPLYVAASRATMGNYHPDTVYDHYHEVSPCDSQTIYPEKQSQWRQMNHFEKCMFWWYVIYQEAMEFRSKHSQVPALEIDSASLFNGDGLDSLLSFLQLQAQGKLNIKVPKNALPQFLLETFPLQDEWRDYRQHPEIVALAEDLGYSFDEVEIEQKMSKYRLPEGVMPYLRHQISYWPKYWHAKAKVEQLLHLN